MDGGAIEIDAGLLEGRTLQFGFDGRFGYARATCDPAALGIARPEPSTRRIERASRDFGLWEVAVPPPESRH